jgi:glycosyltransferase involved in cell wall biosynthesis
VTTARGAEGLLAADGEPAPLSLAESAEAFATATAALLRDRARRRALGARARELMIARHGPEAYGERIDDTYAALMDGATRRDA